ncbi:MAG: MFS transporter, partial [Phycisphaerales bacterium]|nr:MFS transporter [Phycisphaerales bacterium]
MAPFRASLPPGSRLGVLRHRHYRNVWLGAFASSIGNWMELVGVQWVVAQQTSTPEWLDAGLPPPTIMMGYLAAAQLGPTLVLGMSGGLLADRANRKRLLMVTQSLLMLVAASIAVGSHLGIATPGYLLAVSLLHGIVMAFNVPAWQVLTPRLVPREDLAKAITLNGVQFNLARVLGPALGGIIMARFGASVLFDVNTLSFAAFLFAISLTPDAPAPPHDGTSAWRRTTEALSFVFHSRGPRAVFLGMFVFSLLGTPLLRMLPLFVSDVYHKGEDVFGLLLAIMGAGAVIGGLGMRLVPAWYPKHHFIPLAITGGGISITVYSAATSLWLAAPAMFFCGVFWLWSFNSSMAAMQLLVTDRMRGRVLAVCNTVVFGAMPLGSLLAGWVGEVAIGWGGATRGQGVQAGVGVLGAVLAAAGLAMLTWRTPEVDAPAVADGGLERRPGLMAGL